MSRRRGKPVQLELVLPSWGGVREGAGRKRVHPRPSVAHVVRPQLRAWAPVLLTVRMHEDIPNLRARPIWADIVRVFRGFRDRDGLAFVHYSVMSNHMHMLAEHDGCVALSLGMQTFATRLAKTLNRALERSGPVFSGRYHARSLATPTEVRNALRYVLLNAQHHGVDVDAIDPRSTAAIFDGWSTPPQWPVRADFGTSPARSWLLTTGWRRLGRIELADTPGPAGARAAARAA